MKVSSTKANNANSSAQIILDKLWSHEALAINYFPVSLVIMLPMISAIQILTLNFEGMNLNHLSSSTTFDSAVKYLTSMILLRKELDLDALDFLSILVLFLAALYLAALLICLGIVCFCLLKHLTLPQIIARNLSTAAQVHLFIFVLPVHNLLMEAIISIIQDNGQIVREVSLIVVASALDVINIIFSLIPIKLGVLIKTKDPLSRTNNMYLLSTTLQKLIITSLTRVCEHEDDKSFLRTLVLTFNFLFSVISLNVLCRTVPFYNFKLNKRLITIEAWTVGIAAISFLDLIFTGDNSRSKGYILFIVFLLAGTFTTKLAWSYLEKKRFNLNKNVCSSRLSSSETYWIIHQVRYLKKLFSRALQPDLSLKKWTSKQLLEAGSVPDICNLLGLSYNIGCDFPNKISRRDLIIHLLNRITEMNPKNTSIKLLLAGYLIKKSEKIHEPAALIYRVLKGSQHDLSTSLSALLLQEKMKAILQTNLEQKRNEID